MDRGITVADVTTLDAVLSEVTAEPRFRTVLLAAFASMAILIAAVGLCGVIAYSASQRTAEIGLRMALGADSRRIPMLVLREGVVHVVLGGGLRLTAAYGVSRLLPALLMALRPPTRSRSRPRRRVCWLQGFSPATTRQSGRRGSIRSWCSGRSDPAGKTSCATSGRESANTSRDSGPQRAQRVEPGDAVRRHEAGDRRHYQQHGGHADIR